MQPDLIETYLAAERPALEKSEYVNGEIFPVPPAINAHSLINTNVATLLHQQVLNRDCVVLGSAMRLYVPAGPLFTYPDASLVCGPVQVRPDGYDDNLLNPALLVKVLPHEMPTHFKDVFELYYSIPTVQHVLLVTEYAALVSLGSRNENGLLNVYGFAGLDAVIMLPDLGLELPLAEIYRKVPLLA
ncbi:MAG: Uma2 family endonuclease [Janthinobacterium lividum]